MKTWNRFWAWLDEEVAVPRGIKIIAYGAIVWGLIDTVFWIVGWFT